MSASPFPFPAHELQALRRCGRRRVGRRFARVLAIALVVLPFAFAFTPWQQNLHGEGRVIEYDPVHRPMPIQARVDGVVLHWHVREGQMVKVGDPIVDLADNDPRLLERLRDQLLAAEQKRDASMGKRDRYAERVVQAEQARLAAMRVADDDVAAAVQTVEVAKQNLAVAEATVRMNDFLRTMFEGLAGEGIAPGFELQRAVQQADIARAQVKATTAAIAAAEAALSARRSARVRVERDEQAKVESARADHDQAVGDVAEAEGSVLRLQRDLARQQQQSVTAPIDGYVQNLFANGQGGGFVKQATTLALLVPTRRQLAVELWVDGNDVTFIDPGRHVRLQFEGWPAIQWVGWPSAAIGTFGGTVAFVDRFGDAQGKFRVMVLPDERPFATPEGPVIDALRRWLTFDRVATSDNPHRWPGEPWLRQGLLARGWVLLDRVSLGFEVWRQLNGFPPSLQRPLDGAGKTDGNGKGNGGGK